MKVLAGIVVYKPNIERLRENIKSVVVQVDQVVLFLNGSETEQMLMKKFEPHSKVNFISNSSNMGIAFGLRKIMNYAIANSFDWVLSIDQDSVCQPGLIETYKKYVTLPDVAILTCNIRDRNFDQLRGFKDTQPYKEVEKCITAGSFMSVEAYRNSDGYDTKMFIDGVDWDICYNLKRHLYKIFKINFDGILQEVGHGKNVTLLGKKYITYGESPLRNYYAARNDVYLAKKYPEYISMGKTLIREIRTEVLIILYETEKWQKIKMRWKGTVDGMKHSTDRHM